MLFLKIKHWQLFLIIIGIPILYQFIPSRITLNYAENSSFFISFIIILILEKLLILSWLFSTGIKLNEKCNVPNSIKLFKLLFIIPLLDIIVAIIYISSAEIFLLFQMFLVIHICSLLTQFVIITIVSKNLKSVEKQTEVSITKCVEEIILILLFFPIGIWKIQPRINKIFSEAKKSI